jgi:hypothetical protein
MSSAACPARDGRAQIAHPVDRMPTPRRIGAAGKRHPSLEHGAQRKRVCHSLFAEYVHQYVATRGDVAHVRDEQQAESQHALDAFGREQPIPTVLDTVPMVAAPLALVREDRLPHVQDVVEGSVTVRVDAHPQPGTVRPLAQVAQLVERQACDAAIVRLAHVWVVKGGQPAAHAAVVAHLHATDAEPVVAEASRNTKPEQVVQRHLGLVDADQQADAHGQASLAVQALVRQQWQRVLDDLVNGRDAAAQDAWQLAVDGGHVVVQGGARHVIPHQVDGRPLT